MPDLIASLIPVPELPEEVGEADLAEVMPEDGDAICFLDRMSYDATPGKVYVSHGDEPSHSEKTAKLFAIQQDWACLLRVRHPGSLNDNDKKFLLLRGRFGTFARVGDRETAECVRNVLLKAGPLPAGLTAFKHVLRLAESDEHPSNVKAEKILPEARPEAWAGSTLHAICVAHKVHPAAEKTWTLEPEVVSNMIHTYKVLGVAPGP